MLAKQIKMKKDQANNVEIAQMCSSSLEFNIKYQFQRVCCLSLLFAKILINSRKSNLIKLREDWKTKIQCENNYL